MFIYFSAAITYLYKGYLCYNASRKVYHLLANEQEESALKTGAKVTASAFMALSQAGDVIMDLAAPPEVQLVSKAVVGTIDVAGSIMEKSMQEEISLLDGLDVVSTVFFRAVEGLHIATTTHLKWKEEEKLALQLCRTGGAVIKTARFFFSSPLDRFTKIPTAFLQDRVLLCYQCPLAERPIRFIFVVKETLRSSDPVYYEKREILRRMQDHPEERPPRWPSTVPFTREHIVPWKEVQNQIDQRLSLLLAQAKASDFYKRSVLEIQKAKQIADFALIPTLFQEDEVLLNYSCNLTHRPMRFVYVVQGTEDALIPIFYEKTAILRWMHEHPEERPRKWPASIPCQADRLIAWAPIQTFIDRRLHGLFEQTKRQLKGEANSPSMTLRSFAEGPSLPPHATVDNLAQIPEDFLGDETLGQYVCPLQERPIRMITVVRGTERSARPVYYEQRAIQSWIQRHPTVLPSAWPRNVALSQENLIPWKPIQYVINRQIRNLLDYTNAL